jgi:hypothetical protein
MLYARGSCCHGRREASFGYNPTFFALETIFGVDKATFSELDLPRFAEGFLAQSSDAQKGRNFFQV